MRISYGPRARERIAAQVGFHPIDGPGAGVSYSKVGGAAHGAGVDTMKARLVDLARRYLAALREHVQRGERAALQAAHGLGLRAVAMGLETLDIARIHETAMAELTSPDRSTFGRGARIERAGRFFAEVIIPIEKTHRTALDADASVIRLSQRLRRRTAESVASTRLLKRSIAQRKAAEQALERSKKHLSKLLDESRRLEKLLRRLTCDVLSAQESEQKKVSRRLRDVIAQTLLGIELRLASLRKSEGATTKIFKKEIAGAQRLMRQSVKAIHRFAREFGRQHEA